MTVLDIRDRINERIWNTISPTLDLSDRSYEGQLVGIVAEALAKLWEVSEASNSSMDVDKAIGAALDALCVLTGTFRRGASASTATLQLTGADATFIPAGSAARVPAGARFDTIDDATLATVDAWTITTGYVIGDLVTNGGKVYQCTIAGTSAGSGGPTGTSTTTAETDNDVSWRFLGEGTAAAEAPARATENGPLVANSGTIVEIVTPVGGWTGANNILDATIGKNQMQDAELRVLRELELAQPGTGTPDAIRAALLGITEENGFASSVTSATVFVNNTDLTNGDGMPPHSVEAMVLGGEDQDIYDMLLANVAGGIPTTGTEDGVSTDSQGTEYEMHFTRPSEINIYVDVVLVKEAATYPEDGDDQVKAAIVAYGDAQATGKNAVASRIAAAAFTVTGVLDVTLVELGIVPGPSSSATIAIGLRELAVFDTSRITVATSDGVP